LFIFEASTIPYQTLPAIQGPKLSFSKAGEMADDFPYPPSPDRNCLLEA
jgi:hypothetical protein